MAKPVIDQSQAKIDRMLLAELEKYPKIEHGVVVVFAKMPATKTLARLKLRAASESEAIGHLLRDEIFALVKRPDVTSVRARPKYKLL
jgi:hypothetical protein